MVSLRKKWISCYCPSCKSQDFHLQAGFEKGEPETGSQAPEPLSQAPVPSTCHPGEGQWPSNLSRAPPELVAKPGTPRCQPREHFQLFHFPPCYRPTWNWGRQGCWRRQNVIQQAERGETKNYKASKSCLNAM